MDETLLIIAGAFLLVAGAIVPKKSRDFFSNILSGTNLKPWNSQNIDVQSNGDGFDYSSSMASIAGAPSNSIDVKKLPSNRALTDNEIRALAKYVVETYGLNANDKDLVAIAYIESSFKPSAYRHERRKDGTIWDTSWGLMQTLLGTARDMHAKGYKAFGLPTVENLKNPLISMYFGASYIDWLKQNWPNKSSEWHVRAYNGGPGWESTPNGAKNTAIYYKKFVDAWKRLSIQVSFGGN